MSTPALTPTAIVQSIYAAFARGDIVALLAQLRDDVDWHVNVDLSAPGAAAIPLFAPRRGPAQVGQFFTDLGRSLEIHAFTPRAFLSGGLEVAANVALDCTVRSTGRRLAMETMHYWTLDSDGRVARFVDFFDTLGEAASWDAVQARV